MPVWVVRSLRAEGYEQLAFDHGFVAVGWSPVGDLASRAHRSQIRDAVKAAYPFVETESADSYAEQLGHDIEIGWAVDQDEVIARERLGLEPDGEPAVYVQEPCLGLRRPHPDELRRQVQIHVDQSKVGRDEVEAAARVVDGRVDIWWRDDQVRQLGVAEALDELVEPTLDGLFLGQFVLPCGGR